jgi:hypothetical protein
VGVDDAVRQRDNESLLEINGSSVIPTGRLWAFGNFSRFVLPGAVRIAATTTDGRLTLDAFKNTSGAVTVVVLNTSKRTDPVTVSLSGTGVSDGHPIPDQFLEQHRRPGDHQRVRRCVQLHNASALARHLPDLSVRNVGDRRHRGHRDCVGRRPLHQRQATGLGLCYHPPDRPLLFVAAAQVKTG